MTSFYVNRYILSFKYFIAFINDVYSSLLFYKLNYLKVII